MAKRTKKRIRRRKVERWKGDEKMELWQILVAIAAVVYLGIAILVFVVQTQLPVTLGLAVAHTLFWPLWIAGYLRGVHLPMD